MARKVSGYSRFVGKKMRAGMTMKQAARAWKGGSRKTRRYSKKRHKVARRSRRTARIGRHRPVLYRTKRGWKAGKRSRYHLKGVRINRRRRSGRRYGRRSSRRYSLRHNPVMSTIKGVFTRDVLVNGAEIGLGALLGVGAPTYLLNKWTGAPTWLKSGVGNYVALLVGTGILSALVGKVLKKPRLARNLLIGGVAGVALKATGEYLKPALTGPNASGAAQEVGKILGLSDMDDDDDALAAVLASRGMSSYLTPSAMVRAALPGRGMSDYINPASLVQDTMQNRIV
jgi:hypothetical protein